MNKLGILLIACVVLVACSGNKAQEKELRDQILKVHDKVMGSDEALMKNKMQLDSLIKVPSLSPLEKTNMKAIELKLDAAEQAMEAWMQKFDPDVSSKSHDEILQYYHLQKNGILSVDSLINAAVDESGRYLSSRSK